jgi:hypothetical protein
LEKTERDTRLTKSVVDLLKEQLKDQSTKEYLQVEEIVTRTIQETETRKIRITSGTISPSQTAEPVYEIDYLSPATVLTVSYPLIDEAIVRRIRDNFEDIEERQILFFQFKQHLEDIRKVLPIKRGGKDRVFIGLIDAVRNLRSEDLTLNQLSAIKEVTTKLNESVELRGESADQCLDILIEANLEPVPKILGIAKYYEA